MTEAVTQDRKSAGLEKHSNTLIPLIAANVLIASGTNISTNVLEHVSSMHYGRSAASEGK
jgi:hypothetical protein